MFFLQQAFTSFPFRLKRGGAIRSLYIRGGKMDLFQLQPIHIYVGLAIVGFFSGIGASVGQTVSKLYIEPWIKRVHKVHKRIGKRLKRI
jgi:hypothetical protein